LVGRLAARRLVLRDLRIGRPAAAFQDLQRVDAASAQHEEQHDQDHDARKPAPADAAADRNLHRPATTSETAGRAALSATVLDIAALATASPTHNLFLATSPACATRQAQYNCKLAKALHRVIRFLASPRHLSALMKR